MISMSIIIPTFSSNFELNKAVFKEKEENTVLSLTIE